MAKKTTEAFAYLLEMMTAEKFEGVSEAFTYIEEGELLPVSKGGFQKTIEFGLTETLNFALVSKLSMPDGVKDKDAILEVYLAIRKAGKWRDYYDALILPEYETEAEVLAVACQKVVNAMMEEAEKEGGKVLVVDGTNRPLENMKRLRSDRKEMMRCNNLFMCLET